MSDLNRASSAAPAVERLAVEALPDRPRKTPLRAVEPPAGADTAAANDPPPSAPGASTGQASAERVIADLYTKLKSELGTELGAALQQGLARRPTIAPALQAAFATIAKIVAVRLQLLLALIGTFVLALGAMAWQSNAGLWIVIAFASLTVLPLVALEYLGRPRPPQG